VKSHWNVRRRRRRRRRRHFLRVELGAGRYSRSRILLVGSPPPPSALLLRLLLFIAPRAETWAVAGARTKRQARSRSCPPLGYRKQEIQGRGVGGAGTQDSCNLPWSWWRCLGVRGAATLNSSCNLPLLSMLSSDAPRAQSIERGPSAAAAAAATHWRGRRGPLHADALPAALLR
jgi:hypothetical protein